MLVHSMRIKMLTTHVQLVSTKLTPKTILDLLKKRAMLLNKLPVLDKGYVAILDSSLSGKVLKEIESEHFKGKINIELLDVATLTLQIRCPIFFQVYLQQRKLQTVNVIEQNVECYTPDVSEINTGDPATDKEITDHISNTTKALLMTSKAYEQDGLNKFMSHAMIPVSVYNTVIVAGPLTEWIKLVNSKRKLPYPIQAYVDVIKDAVEAEWPKLHTYIKGM